MASGSKALVAIKNKKTSRKRSMTHNKELSPARAAAFRMLAGMI